MRAPTLALTALLLFVGLAPAPSQAARSSASANADCQLLLELYHDCHRLGVQSGSALTCVEGAQDFTVRSQARPGGKSAQAARALADLVCATGCEDAEAGRPPATPQEFSEAFCDNSALSKAQGGRP